MHRRRAPLIAIVVGLVTVLFRPGPALACSPPFEEPTIAALGPRQVVVVGTIGERLAAGRVFNVERWFNGGAPTGRILIAFKEGEPVGDCSYLVFEGQRLIIAPDMSPDGALHAILPTLQADPDSDLGRRYVAEAIRLFGPGVAPEAGSRDGGDPVGSVPAAPILGLVLAGVVSLFATVVLVARRRRI